MNTPPAINRSSQVVLTICGLIFAFSCLAVVLFPVFVRHRRGGESGPCYSHLRQLVVAAHLYAEDHNGNFPGFNWVADINYKGMIDNKILTCYKDTRKTSTQPISYGYSGLLLRADGSGVNVEQVMSPEEVGAFCDASPTKTYPDGGIVAGGGLQPLSTVVTPEIRHNEALLAAYVDGHADAQRGPFNVKDLANDTTCTFYLANALGFVDNPVGGMSDFTPRVLGKGPVAIGGDPCTAPLLRAAAAAWRQKAGVNIINCGFDGQYATKKRPAACIWGTGDGMKPAGNAVAIGRDAVVVIVRKGGALANHLEDKKHQGFIDGSMDWYPLMSYDTIRQLFNVQTDPRSYSANHRSFNISTDTHSYTYNRDNGTRAFFTRILGKDGKPMPISATAITVKDSLEMMDKVARDSMGIGYCSAAMITMAPYNIRLTIVDLQLPGGRIVHYPQNYPKGDYKRRAIIPATPTWPLMRTLYAVSTLPKSNHFVDEMLAPGSPGARALQAGPLFKASYYRPVAEP